MCVTSLLWGPWAHLWPFYGLYCKRFSLSINKTLSRGDRLPANPRWGEGGWSGVGVVIFTPWCFMLHHCFADPLACFRYIFWNVENELQTLLTPPPPPPPSAAQEIIIKWVIDAHIYSAHLSVWCSV